MKRATLRTYVGESVAERDHKPTCATGPMGRWVRGMAKPIVPLPDTYGLAEKEAEISARLGRRAGELPDTYGLRGAQ